MISLTNVQWFKTWTAPCGVRLGGRAIIMPRCAYTLECILHTQPRLSFAVLKVCAKNFVNNGQSNGESGNHCKRSFCSVLRKSVNMCQEMTKVSIFTATNRVLTEWDEAFYTRPHGRKCFRVGWSSRKLRGLLVHLAPKKPALVTISGAATTNFRELRMLKHKKTKYKSCSCSTKVLYEMSATAHG